MKPWSHAEPQNWFPSDTSIAGDECARVTSAKLLRKSEALSVSQTLLWKPPYCWSTSLNIRWQKMVPRVTKPPSSFFLCWAAVVAVLCKMCIFLTQVLGSLVQCCPCPCHGLPEHLSETLSNTLDPPKQQRLAAGAASGSVQGVAWKSRYIYTWQVWVCLCWLSTNTRWVHYILISLFNRNVVFSNCLN